MSLPLPLPSRIHARTPAPWKFRDGATGQPQFTWISNSNEVDIAAAEAGIGLTRCLAHQAAASLRAGRLRIVGRDGSVSAPIAGVPEVHARGQGGLLWKNLAAGLLLGAINFGNILFYVQAHRALPGQPAVVFASMNIGVVVLGTLVGVFAFREPLSRLNRAGIVLAILAIGLIALGRA